MEKIGYIPKEDLGCLASGLCAIAPKLLQPRLRFANREEVEADDNLIQPVCVANFITSDGKLFAVRKTPEAAKAGSPEYDKLLLYVGGHMNPCDQQSFAHAVRREVLEELGVSLDFSNIQPFGIYTPTTAKSARHLAICFRATVSADEFQPQFTGEELAFGRHSGIFLAPSEVLAEQSHLEPWSLTLLEIAMAPFWTQSSSSRASSG